MACVPYEMTVDNEFSESGSRSLDWDKTFGENGAFCRMSIDTYNYDIHHRKLLEVTNGADYSIAGAMASQLLAYHWGDFVTANAWQDKNILLLARLLASTNPILQQHTIWYLCTCSV
eukprot:COSAG01_NODE_14846_length_1403_cov_3.180982_1_plen_116_part_10